MTNDKTPPTATDAQGVGEAPKAVAWMEPETKDVVSAMHRSRLGFPERYSVPLYTHPTASTTAGLTEAVNELPPRPEPVAFTVKDYVQSELYAGCGFTDHQMQDYARACAEKWNVRLDGGAAK